MMPRGNYPDAWAVRPQDLEGPTGDKYKLELKTRISRWFDTIPDLDAYAAQIASQYQEKLKAHLKAAVNWVATDNHMQHLHHMLPPAMHFSQKLFIRRNVGRFDTIEERDAFLIQNGVPAAYLRHSAAAEYREAHRSL